MFIVGEFKAENISELASWPKSDRELLQWAGPSFKWPLKASFLEDRLGKMGKNEFAYQACSSNIFVGYFELAILDTEKRVGKLGRVIVNPSYRNRGYGGEMLRSGITIAFEELKLQELQLVVFDFNVAAISCYKKLGFEIDKNVPYEPRFFHSETWRLLGMSITPKLFEQKMKKEKDLTEEEEKKDVQESKK